MNAHATEDPQELAKRWVGYREAIKVLDCTIRDGGLMNDHQFSDEVVRAVYQACAEAGIDYMEIGYKGARGMYTDGKHGTWKFCAEDDLRRIVGDKASPLKISVMADVDRCDYKNDILPRKDSVVDLVRVACYIHQVPGALDMIKDAHDKGYETTINLMSVSTVSEKELDSALGMFAASEVGTLYVVDSFGSLFSEQVAYLVRKYLAHAESAGKTVGMHAHNNQQLAFANTIEAITLGANMLDGSLAGLGRGAGNCHTEYLVGFLRNPKYHMRPLLDCIQHHIEPLRKELLWGPDFTYYLTGHLNQHPRAAMEFNEGPDRGNYLKFFDEVMA